jgi:hypothetical protein
MLLPGVIRYVSRRLVGLSDDTTEERGREFSLTHGIFRIFSKLELLYDFFRFHSFFPFLASYWSAPVLGAARIRHCAEGQLRTLSCDGLPRFQVAQAIKK